MVQGLEGKKGCGWRCGQLDREMEFRNGYNDRDSLS